LGLNTNNVSAQEFGSQDSIRVSFVSEVNFTSTSQDKRKEASAGIGTLGVQFERGYVYGSASFVVYSQNSEIETDSNETQLFGTNLLLPENSSSKTSNFRVLLGINIILVK